MGWAVTKGDEFIGGGWWRRDATEEEEKKRRKEKEKEWKKKGCRWHNISEEIRRGCEEELLARVVSRSIILPGDQRYYILFRMYCKILLFC